MNPCPSEKHLPARIFFFCRGLRFEKEKARPGAAGERNAGRGRGSFYDEPSAGGACRGFARASPKVAAQDARHYRQFGERQLLHGTGGNCRGGSDSRESCQRTGRPAALGCAGLFDRGDRRAVARGKNSEGGAGTRAQPPSLGESFRGVHARDHDHGHAAEVGGGRVPDLRQGGPDSQLLQRHGNDRAAHGDDVGISRHGRCDRICAAFGGASAGGRTDIQLHHGGRRHFHERYGGDSREWAVRRAENRAGRCGIREILQGARNGLPVACAPDRGGR